VKAIALGSVAFLQLGAEDGFHFFEGEIWAVDLGAIAATEENF